MGSLVPLLFTTDVATGAAPPLLFQEYSIEVFIFFAFMGAIPAPVHLDEIISRADAHGADIFSVEFTVRLHLSSGLRLSSRVS